MTSNDDERYETEEFLVYVDLDTKLLDEQLSKTNTKVKFLGIDTENPIMQLNNQLFKGNFCSSMFIAAKAGKMSIFFQFGFLKKKIFLFSSLFESVSFKPFWIAGSFEYSMGTHCFFQKSKKLGGGEDACFNEMPKKLYEYYAKTNKVLKMKRIFVEEKESEAGAETADSDIESDLEHLRISKTYGEALNQFLKPDEQPPREIVENPQEDSDDDAAVAMEIDPTLEEPAESENPSMSEEPSISEQPSASEANSEEIDANKILQQAQAQLEAEEEFERLTDPDYEPRQWWVLNSVNAIFMWKFAHFVDFNENIYSI